MSVQDFWALLPELIVVLVALVVLFTQRWAQALTLAGAMLAAGALFFVPQGAFLSGAVEINGFALAFKVLFLVVAILVALGSENLPSAARPKEYYTLTLFATAGMMGVASSADLVLLFVSFELSSLSSYALVAYGRRDERAVEAATKFFIIGALSSAIALYGISLLYGAAGTLNLRELAGVEGALGQLALPFKAGMVLLLAGLAFKVTAVPFHFWAPDAYEGAPAPVAALLASGSKKMAFAALFKIFLVGMLTLKFDWDWLIGLLAVLTMTVGNLMAFNQTSVKRLLAYSSIAQAGYLLTALPVVTAYGVAGGLFHAVTHSITTAGAFLVVGAVAGIGLGEELLGYRGLGKRQPFVALAMTAFLLSLVGIPPLAGFQSKFVLFSSSVEAGLNGSGLLLWLAVAGVFNSALSLFYYLRIIKVMYFETPEPVGQTQGAFAESLAKPSVPQPLLIAIALAFGLVILLGLAPGPLLSQLMAAASSLF